MTLDDAIAQACDRVGIVPPRHGGARSGQWVRTDTVAPRGKGDGSLIFDEDRATAYNWKTGEKATVWVKSEFTVADRSRFAQRRVEDRRQERERAERARDTARRIIAAARFEPHAYLRTKGFPLDLALAAPAETVRTIGGDYLVPDGGTSAIVVPATIGPRLASVQLIWGDGTKKFLFGGNMSGASHRISGGAATWLCEGYATALTVQMALRGMNRRDGVLVCFSAANIAKVARNISWPCYIAADHDASPPARPDQFGGLGAGEYFARQAARPYAMPPEVGTDFDDLRQDEGIFAVQRVLSKVIREATPMR